MKWALLATGWLSLGLGLVGIFLPLLPTTPFLLLAALCFSKASPRLHQWLLEHKITGPIILDWRARRVIRIKAKIVASLLLLPTLYLAVFTEKLPLPVRGALLLVVVGVLLFLWTRKSR